MSVSTAWVKHSLVYHPVGVTTAVVLGALKRLSLPTNTQVESDRSDPTIYPDFTSIVKRKPAVVFSTTALATYISTLGFGATCISSDETHPGLRAFFQKRGCAGPASGSVHMSFDYTSGVIVPTQLTASHRTPAQLSYSFMSQGNPANDAVTKYTSQALPTLVPAGDEKYDLYSLSIGGTSITQRTSISIDFNPLLFELGADGEVEDSLIALDGIFPKITARGFTVSDFGSIDLDGVACTHANSSIVLRKRGVALATAEHIQITFQGLATFDTIQEADDGPSEDVMMVDCTQDASNGPFVVDETYAIA